MSVSHTELVAEIARRAVLSKTEVDAALSTLQDILIESLKKGETIKVAGLTNVEHVSRAARIGRNPRTGEEVRIPAGFGIKISAGSASKKTVTQ